MEQHAVPRNITGFQFKLVGDMTLRQFAYFASGIVIAYIIFRIGPFPEIINLAIACIIALIGVAFAFLPIQERPLDKWLLAFIKSITSPTQFLWHKYNEPPDILIRPLVFHMPKQQPAYIANHADAKLKLKAYLATLPTSPHDSLNIKEKQDIEKTMALFNMSQVVINPITHAPNTNRSSSVPSISSFVSKTSGFASSAISSIPKMQTVQPIPNKPVSAAVQPAPASANVNSVWSLQTAPFPAAAHNTPQPVSATNNPHVPMTSPAPARQSAEQINTMQTQTPQTATIRPPTETPQFVPVTPKINDGASNQTDKIQEQLTKLASEKRDLENELRNLKELVNQMQKPQVVRLTQPSQPPKEPTIKIVSSKSAVNDIGIPNMPTTANIILGAIRDPQKKLLPNIIITIKDKNGMPLRALKTNKLGQFEIATPLPNGVYFLEVEDPLKRYIFDIAQITLSGNVAMPVEIIAKGEKEIMREKLTKELFGGGGVI